ncbi:PQQ-binding-like beta-propeller repeat protein [Roseateles sp. UC29_93]|uniref:outer membrane protein assembly factor BamB family protein n=1 Tax=Roseateles sp. UC29_93 TaxID=3350177 RepID=UPI00366C03AA
MLSTMRRRLPALGNLCAPIVALMVSVMLSGCGGAVEKAIGNLLDETKVPYSLSQNTADCKPAEPGASCPDVKIYASKRHDGINTVRPLWNEVPDNNATLRVVDHVYRDVLPSGDVQLSVGFVTQLQPGVYTGTIEINVVLFEILTNYVPNKVRYRLEIGTGGAPTLTTLPAAIPGQSDWAGYGGTSARTGYAPLTLDPAKFSARWARWLYGGTIPGEALGLGQGRIAVPTLRADSAATTNASVIGLQDGKDLWSATLPMAPTQAMVAGDRLFWSTRRSRVMMTSTTSGDLLGDHTSQAYATIDPGWTVAGDRLLLPVDPEVNHVTAFNTADLSQVWSTVLSDRVANVNYIGWGPTVDATAGLVYINAGGIYRVLRLSDGGILAEQPVPTREDQKFTQFATFQAPVLPDDGVSAVLLSHREMAPGEVVDNHLTVVDRATGAQRWDVAGQFMDHPVTAHGIVYASNQQTKAVEARQLSDGALLWSWPMESTDGYWQRQMVLTDSHLFVSTDKQTLALDLATRQVAWRTPNGGWLGLTREGVLVVLAQSASAQPLTTLKTFNLR